mgnify:CR=1 FL=1
MAEVDELVGASLELGEVVGGVAVLGADEFFEVAGGVGDFGEAVAGGGAFELMDQRAQPLEVLASDGMFDVADPLRETGDEVGDKAGQTRIGGEIGGERVEG